MVLMVLIVSARIEAEFWDRTFIGEPWTHVAPRLQIYNLTTELLQFDLVRRWCSETKGGLSFYRRPHAPGPARFVVSIPSTGTQARLFHPNTRRQLAHVR